MFNCLYEKKSEGDSHLFSMFFADLKPALEYLLNNELLKLLNGCTIILKDEDVPNAYFNKRNKNIYITTGLLEYLWWLSYFNYDLYAKSPWGNTAMKFDVHHQHYGVLYTEQHDVVINRLKDIHNKTKAVEWPNLIEKPKSLFDVSDGTSSNAASELMFHSLAVILLHELCHRVIHVNHINYPRLIEEQIADWFAFTQFFKLSEHNTLGETHIHNAIGKRFIACVNAGFFLLINNLNHPHGAYYPNGFNRLETIISHNSKILDLKDDRLYNPQNDIYDMRKVISYVTFLLVVHANEWISPDNKYGLLVRKLLADYTYDSPFYVYKTLKLALVEYLDWKEIQANAIYVGKGIAEAKKILSLT